MVFLLVAAALLVLLAGLSWFLLRCPALRAPAADAKPAEAVSILIPARDEAATIESTVRGALAQDVPELEVIVVDDHSSDETPRILASLARRDPRLRVMRSRPRPPGWTGKANALDHASRHARGEWLLFLDADAVLAPDAAAAAVAAARRHGATFLSLWPLQWARGFWERQVQPVVFAFTAAGDALQRIWQPAYPAGLSAWGLFILAQTHAYRRVGGHAAVWDRLLEDRELCRAFREAGERTVALDGRRYARVHMYAGLPELWRGWGKSLFPSLGHHLGFTLATAAYVLTVTCGPLAGTLAAAAGGEAAVFGRWAALLLLQLIAGGALASRLVAVPVWSGLNPLGGALYAALLVHSARRHRSGRGVAWKGRRYADPGGR